MEMESRGNGMRGDGRAESLERNPWTDALASRKLLSDKKGAGGRHMAFERHTMRVKSQSKQAKEFELNRSPVGTLSHPSQRVRVPRNGGWRS